MLLMVSYARNSPTILSHVVSHKTLSPITVSCSCLCWSHNYIKHGSTFIAALQCSCHPSCTFPLELLLCHSCHTCFYIVPSTVVSKLPIIYLYISFHVISWNMQEMIMRRSLFFSLLFLDYSCHCYKFLHHSCHCCSCIIPLAVTSSLHYSCHCCSCIIPVTVTSSCIIPVIAVPVTVVLVSVLSPAVVSAFFLPPWLLKHFYQIFICIIPVIVVFTASLSLSCLCTCGHWDLHSVSHSCHSFLRRSSHSCFSIVPLTVVFHYFSHCYFPLFLSPLFSIISLTAVFHYFSHCCFPLFLSLLFSVIPHAVFF